MAGTGKSSPRAGFRPRRSCPRSTCFPRRCAISRGRARSSAARRATISVHRSRLSFASSAVDASDSRVVRARSIRSASRAGHAPVSSTNQRVTLPSQWRTGCASNLRSATSPPARVAVRAEVSTHAGTGAASPPPVRQPGNSSRAPWLAYSPRPSAPTRKARPGASSRAAGAVPTALDSRLLDSSVLVSAVLDSSLPGLIRGGRSSSDTPALLVPIAGFRARGRRRSAASPAAA